MGRGLILAAPASGSGKTTLTLALLRHYRNAGLCAAGAKSGPDYIDPGFHAAASGRPSLNLDAWAMRDGTIAHLVSSINADLVLCEGAMGLFDGGGRAADKGSTADLAALTGWPVVLVVDAQGQSASVAALLEGFVRHRRDITIAGVMFNRVGSERHAAMLRAATAQALPDLVILGTQARDAALVLPSRHLGLVQAGENQDLDRFLNVAARQAAQSIDVAALFDLARLSKPFFENDHKLPPPLGQRIAVAKDVAFAFAYPHLLAAWRAQGAEIASFSPLADEAPRADADAVFLPGGYPELHAGKLAAATRFLTGLKTGAGRGALIYGECGGYMALGKGLIDRRGVSHAMAGLLPVVTSFAEPKRHLGYRQAQTLNGPWTDRRFRGHEFHFASVAEGAATGTPLFQLADADGVDRGVAGHVDGRVFGSFFHMIDSA